MALQDRWYMQDREAQGEAWRRHRPRERVVRFDPLVRSRGKHQGVSGTEFLD